MTDNAWVRKVKAHSKKRGITYGEAMIELSSGKSKRRKRPSTAKKVLRNALPPKTAKNGKRKRPLSDWQKKIAEYRKKTGASPKEAMIALKAKKTVKDIGKLSRAKKQRESKKCSVFTGKTSDGKRISIRIE